VEWDAWVGDELSGLLATETSFDAPSRVLIFLCWEDAFGHHNRVRRHFLVEDCPVEDLADKCIGTPNSIRCEHAALTGRAFLQLLSSWRSPCRRRFASRCGPTTFAPPLMLMPESASTWLGIRTSRVARCCAGCQSESRRRAGRVAAGGGFSAAAASSPKCGNFQTRPCKSGHGNGSGVAAMSAATPFTISVFPGREFTYNARQTPLSTLSELAAAVTVSNWAPATFVGGHRSIANAIQAGVIGFDFDVGALTLDAARRTMQASPYGYFIGTTKSHQSLKNGVQQGDRFRIVLLLSEPISSDPDYKATLAAVAEELGFADAVDKACKDISRYWMPFKATAEIRDEGIRVKPRRADLSAVAGGGMHRGAGGAAGVEVFAGDWPDERPAGLPADIAGAREAALAWPPAVEGQAGEMGGSNRTLFSLAVSVIRGHGVPADKAEELLWEVYNPRCLPPWQPAERQQRCHRFEPNQREGRLLGNPLQRHHWAGRMAVADLRCRERLRHLGRHQCGLGSEDCRRFARGAGYVPLPQLCPCAPPITVPDPGPPPGPDASDALKKRHAARLAAFNEYLNNQKPPQPLPRCPRTARH